MRTSSSSWGRVLGLVHGVDDRGDHPRVAVQPPGPGSLQVREGGHGRCGQRYVEGLQDLPKQLVRQLAGGQHGHVDRAPPLVSSLAGIVSTSSRCWARKVASLRVTSRPSTADLPLPARPVDHNRPRRRRQSCSTRWPISVARPVNSHPVSDPRAFGAQCASRSLATDGEILPRPFHQVRFGAMPWVGQARAGPGGGKTGVQHGQPLPFPSPLWIASRKSPTSRYSPWLYFCPAGVASSARNPVTAAVSAPGAAVCPWVTLRQHQPGWREIRQPDSVGGGRPGVAEIQDH